MNIAVYVPSLAKNSRSRFIVETFFSLFERFPSQRLFLITDDNFDSGPLFSKIEILILKPAPKNLLLKKLWIEKALVNALKKNNTDLFICADNFCSLNILIPQLVLFPDPEKIKPAYAKKTRLLIVASRSKKEELITKKIVPGEKIIVTYPSPNENYRHVDHQKKESVKEKYSEGREYFLCNNNFQKQDEFISLLKSFSHFKKRQQSSFKLLLLTDIDFLSEKSIENYKYRSDVVVIRSNDIKEKATITAAAYALVIPIHTEEAIGSALNAMQSGVPIIITKNSGALEVAADAALVANNDIKDIGEKMMQLYKDENLRSELIKKGNALVKNFAEERSASELWQSIMKVMN